MDISEQVIPENSARTDRGHGGFAAKKAKTREIAWVVRKWHKKIKQGIHSGRRMI